MADATFKPSSGDDLVLSNDDGSKKIEITDSGDVECTGDFKTTTVKSTNLKANDGTAGLSIADSTGRVTFSETNPTITLGSNATFPAGHILQVIQAINSTEISKSDTSSFDIVTVDITPASTSNKILVFGEVMGARRGTAAAARLDVFLTRDSTNIHASGANFYTLDAQDLRQGGFAISKLDSPSSTSQITYKIRGAWAGISGTVYVNQDGNSGNSTITVMEVSG